MIFLMDYAGVLSSENGGITQELKKGDIEKWRVYQQAAYQAPAAWEIHL